MQVSSGGVHRWSARSTGLILVAVLWVQGSALAATSGRAAVPAGPAAVVPDAQIYPAPAPEALPVIEASLFGNVEGNRFVAAWRDRLTETPPRLLDAYLARPDAWISELGPILEAHDVPGEFLYLALIESGMDPAAVSPAEAVGLWQFRDATARQYGLVVEGHLDERVDERRATLAASRYLRDLYEQFGTWELAAAAYNAGPGRVQRALDASGAQSYWELIEAGHLPGETRAYVPKFLAVVQLAAERVESSGDASDSEAVSAD